MVFFLCSEFILIICLAYYLIAKYNREGQLKL